MKKKDFEWKLQLFADETPPEGADDDAVQDDDKDDDKPEVKYTDEDVQKFIDKALAKDRKKQEKELDEAQKLAKMTAEEKEAHRIKQLEDELAEMKAANAKNEMSKVARGLFEEANVNVSDAIIRTLITEDAEDTKEVVQSFIDQYKKDVSKAVKEALKGETPKKGTGSGSSMTREDILKVKNRAERQKLINEHKDLFGI